MQPPPRDPDSPSPLQPGNGSGEHGNWFLVGRSSEPFGPHRPPTVPPGQPAWPAVPGFEILCELGRGASGVVFMARQNEPERTVAVKLFREPAFRQPESLARFRAEAQAAARLQHANIVQIFDLGDHDGRPFLVLEYLDAGPLHRWLARTPPSPHQAAALLEPLARALQHGHDRGVVHGDLKPANILLGSESAPALAEPGSLSVVPGAETRTLPVPKISGFGLATVVPAPNGLPGTAGGTPQYMSPEQSSARPGDAGPATDVYALGAILYEMLTGRPPFEGASTPETLLLLRTVEPVPPRRLRPRTPKDLETICLKCLEKNPARRYASAAALADDLRRFLSEKPILARPTAPLERALRWRRRNPRLAIAAGLAALLALTGPLAAVWIAGIAARTAADRDRTAAALTAAQSDQFTARERLADLSASAGLAAWHEGNPAGATLWFAHAARLAHEAGDAGRERANRIRFRNAQRRYIMPADVALALAANAAPQPAGIRTVELPTRAPVAVAVSPDGRFFIASAASGDATTVTRVYDAATGRPAGPGLPANGYVLHAALAPARPLAAVAVADHAGSTVLQLWNWETGRVAGPPFAMPSEPRSIAFSRDGAELLTCGPDETLRVSDARTGEVRLRICRKGGNFTSVAFSPDGRYLATTHERNPIAVWEWATGNPIPAATPPAQTEGAAMVCFSADGTLLLAAGPGRAAHLWDWRSGKPACPPLLHTANVINAHFLPDPAWVVTAAADGSVQVWDRRDGRSVFVGPPSPRCHNAVPARNGRTLIAGCSEGRVNLFDFDDVIIPNELPTSSDPNADRLGRLAKVLSGCELRDDMTVTALSTEEWQALAKEVCGERRRPAGLTPTGR